MAASGRDVPFIEDLLYIICLSSAMSSVPALVEAVKEDQVERNQFIDKVFRRLKRPGEYLQLLGHAVSQEAADRRIRDGMAGRNVSRLVDNPRTRALFNRYSPVIRVLDWDEDTDPSNMFEFHYTSRDMWKVYGSLLPDLRTARMHLTSSAGFAIMHYLPSASLSSFTSLEIRLGPDMTIKDLGALMREQRELTELTFRYDHSAERKWPELENVAPCGHCPKLRKLVVCDSPPVFYSAAQLSELLRDHPQLEHVSLNPRPTMPADVAGPMPRVDCLAAVATSAPASLKYFGCFVASIYPRPVHDGEPAATGLEVLDTGASQVRSHKNYLCALFGHSVVLEGDEL